MKRWAAIVLAAGQSARFGKENKLAADLHGKPVLAHVLDALDGLGQTLLVTQDDGVPVMRDGITLILNSRPEDGMGASLSLGAKALQPCDGAFVVLGDMPVLDPALLHEMARRLDGYDIVVPESGGRHGHPVLFGPACFEALRLCRGDTGARHVIASGDYRVATCPVTNAASQLDIDTPEDLAKVRKMSWL